MELETAVRKLLLASDAVTGYVGTKVHKFRLDGVLDGTGGRAVVVRRVGGWARPQQVNTGEYPLLEVQCWADHDRDETGGIAEATAEEKAWALWRVVDPLLHGCTGAVWGEEDDRAGLEVLTCSRWAEGVVLSASQMDGRQRSSEEAVFVSVQYAVECIHGIAA